MKGIRSLVSLLVAAVVAGIVLVALKPDQAVEKGGNNEETPGPNVYVEETLGLQFSSPPIIQQVPREVWLDLSLIHI